MHRQDAQNLYPGIPLSECAISLLLVSFPSILQRPENLSEAWIFRHPESRARFAEALGAGQVQPLQKRMPRWHRCAWPAGHVSGLR